MASAPVSSSQTVLSPASGAPQALQNRLNSLTRRRNSVVMGRHIMRALVPGVWACAIGITLYKTHIIPDAPVWLPLVALGAGALWGIRNGLRARGGTFRAARDADATLGLKDSLGSALSFVAPDTVGSTRAAPAPKTFAGKAKRAILGQGDTFHVAPHALETTLVPALVADAAGRAQSLDPRRVYSWKFDRTAKVLVVGAVLLVGSLFVPDNPLFASKKELAERTAIMKSGEKLAMLSKDVRKRANPDDAKVSDLNKRLEKLGLKMARGRMTKRAALTQIGELKQQLQKAQQQPPRNQNPAQQGGLPQIREAIKKAPMQSQAGQKVQQDLQNNKFQEAARRLEELADKLDKGQLSQKEKEQAAKDMEEIARQLRQQGGQANQQAAKQLEDAAKQLQQPQQQQQQGQQNQQGQQQQQGQQGQQEQGKQQQGQQGQQQQQGQQGGQQKQQQGQQGGQQQGQQGQQKQGGQKGQGQQQQQGQQGQQQGGQQGQKGQQQQSGQQGQGQQGQKNGQQQSGQQGQQQGGQQGQSQQSQSQQGQQQGQQQGGQQGSQSGQQGQSPNGKQGQQGGQSGGGGQQNGQGQEGQSNASGALRDMANSLRQGSGGSGGSSNLRDMMNNLREAENGANGGSASGKGSGRPGQYGSSFQADPNAPTIRPGQNLMPTDPHGAVGGGAGLGSRANAQGNNPGGGVSRQKSSRTGDTRRYEDVWSDRLPKPHAKVDRIKGKWGGSGEVEQLPTRGDGKGGQAHTPYYDVYESYKRDAEDAVGRESVPPAYKAPVKDYFESIKP